VGVAVFGPLPPAGAAVAALLAGPPAADGPAEEDFAVAPVDEPATDPAGPAGGVPDEDAPVAAAPGPLIPVSAVGDEFWPVSTEADG
jgi:hypothetical protein